MIEIPGAVFFFIIVTVFLCGVVVGLLIGENICNKARLL